MPHARQVMFTVCIWGKYEQEAVNLYQEVYIYTYIAIEYKYTYETICIHVLSIKNIYITLEIYM